MATRSRTEWRYVPVVSYSDCWASLEVCLESVRGARSRRRHVPPQGQRIATFVIAQVTFQVAILFMNLSCVQSGFDCLFFEGFFEFDHFVTVDNVGVSDPVERRQQFLFLVRGQLRLVRATSDLQEVREEPFGCFDVVAGLASSR